MKIDITTALQRNAVLEQFTFITDRHLELFDDDLHLATSVQNYITALQAESDALSAYGLLKRAVENFSVVIPADQPNTIGILVEYEFPEDFDVPLDIWETIDHLTPPNCTFVPVGMGAAYTANNAACAQVFFPQDTSLRVVETFLSRLDAALDGRIPEPFAPPASWQRTTGITYGGTPVVGLFLWSDINSPDDPNDMKGNRDYYELPCEPWVCMSASQIRDLMVIISFVDERVGAPQFRVYAELRGQHDLVWVNNPDDIRDFGDL